MHATDSAGTQAGLLVGLAAIQSDIHLLGIGVRAAQDQQEQLVFNLAHRTAQHLGTGVEIARKDVHVNCGYVGAGYGLPSDGMVRSIKLLAQTEGLLFDRTKDVSRTAPFPSDPPSPSLLGTISALCETPLFFEFSLFVPSLSW